MADSRLTYMAPDLGLIDEPLIVSLFKYRQDDVFRIQTPRAVPAQDRELDYPNLVSSRTDTGKHLPIIDLDFPHHYESSTTEGHAHLFLNVPISGFRWVVLMSALRFAGVIEKGYYIWSLRRRGNFVRIPGVEKEHPAESFQPTYGWLFKQRRKKNFDG